MTENDGTTTLDTQPRKTTMGKVHTSDLIMIRRLVIILGLVYSNSYMYILSII